MEELLPLIIGIIWLVYTIYSKGKRKEARKKSSEDNHATKAPSILEQLFSGNEVVEPQPYEATEEFEESQYFEDYDDEVISVPMEESRPFLREELVDFVNEGQAATIPSDNFMMEEKENTENQAERLDFDIRKAIIFSEILNAPYIGYK